MNGVKNPETSGKRCKEEGYVEDSHMDQMGWW